MLCVVYEIHKLSNPNHNYIGKTIMSRWIKGYMGSGDVIIEATKKYGKEAYGRKLLAAFDDEDMAYAYETKLIAEKEPYYNIASGGRGGAQGREVTEETKRKISEGKKGHARPDLAERNRKIAELGANTGKNNPVYRNDVDDELLVSLRKQGCSWRAIGKQVGMSHQGVRLRINNFLEKQ